MGKLKHQITRADQTLLLRATAADCAAKPAAFPQRSCSIDLYDGPGFTGERRRLFAPNTVDGVLLDQVAARTPSGSNEPALSIRIVGQALVRIVHRCDATNSIKVTDATHDLPNIALRNLLAIEVRSVGSVEMPRAISA